MFGKKKQQTIYKEYNLGTNQHTSKPYFVEEDGYLLTGFTVDHLTDKCIEIWTIRDVAMEKILKDRQSFDKMMALQRKAKNV